MLAISCFHVLQNAMYYCRQVEQDCSKQEKEVKATLMEAGKYLSEEEYHVLQNTMYYCRQVQQYSLKEEKVKEKIMEAGQDLSDDDFMVKV